jgi:hypothetical protein
MAGVQRVVKPLLKIFEGGGDDARPSFTVPAVQRWKKAPAIGNFLGATAETHPHKFVL